MIDLGLSKMALIGAVALIVIGPEKLPRVARMAGTLFGRAQRYLGEVKSQVSREIELEEIKRLQQNIEGRAKEYEQSIGSGLAEIEQSPEWHDANEADTYDINAISVKAKNFRRKKLARTTGLPVWYKQRHGVAAHITSGAARMARHRAKTQKPSSFF